MSRSSDFGSISAGADDRASCSVDAILKNADLPSELAARVHLVVTTCRLWRSERADVARELCAHFQDGLARGRSPAELIESFGDPRWTARLITRSRRNMRPAWWRAWRQARRALAATLLLMFIAYGVLAARYFLSSPAITRNISAELNATVLASAPEDRAWPLYVEARRQFGPTPDFMLAADYAEPMRAGDKDFDLLASWLDAHGEALAAVRSAAAKPTHGLLFRSGMDPDLARAYEITSPGYTYDPDAEPIVENPLVMGLLLPHLAEIRRNTKFLAAHAHLAAARGDTGSFLSDVESILGMSEQLLHDRLLLSTTVAVASAGIAMEVVLEESARTGLLGTEDCTHLAHRLAAFADGRIRLEPDFEALMIEDILQRFYSDDGNGDGHPVQSTEFMRLYRDMGIPVPKAMPLFQAFQPIQSAILPSRAEIMERVQRFRSAVMADDQLPPWRHDERSSGPAFSAMMGCSVFSLSPILDSLNGGTSSEQMENLFAYRDIVEARRSAALTVLALTSYKAARARWPADLSELVPSYLPAPPIDPFVGRPLRYVPPRADAGADALPILYSVGVDLGDNSAKSPPTEKARTAICNLSYLQHTRPGAGENGGPTLDPVDDCVGDWILWPVPAPPAPSY